MPIVLLVAAAVTQACGRYGYDVTRTPDARPAPDGLATDLGASMDQGVVDARVDVLDAADAVDTMDVTDSGAPDTPPPCLHLGFDAGAGAPIATANHTGEQNVPAGITPSGSTILVQRGACSTNLSVFIADEMPAGSGTYQTHAVPTLAGATTSNEEDITLEPDGLTLIALNATQKGFVVSTRSGLGLVDFSTPTAGDFLQIRATGSQTLWAPAISGDMLAFYYSVVGDPSPSINGIYESVRASASVPFPPGTRMPALVQGLAQYVNGLSADRLSIFLEASASFEALVLTRTTVAAPFTNPLAPNPPPAVPGLRSRPFAGCTMVLGTCSPIGGCSNEEVCTWSIP